MTTSAMNTWSAALVGMLLACHVAAVPFSMPDDEVMLISPKTAPPVSLI